MREQPSLLCFGDAGDCRIGCTVDGLAVIQFSKPDCPPCELAHKIMEKLEEEFEERVYFGVMNVDDLPEEFITGLDIKYTPTIVLFKDGQVADFISRAVRYPTLKRKIEAHL